MRLTSQEISVIQSLVAKFSQGFSYQLYLYGSRVDDSKKGGDIDLLIVTDKKASETFLLENKHRLLAAIERCLKLKSALKSELKPVSCVQQTRAGP